MYNKQIVSSWSHQVAFSVEPHLACSRDSKENAKHAPPDVLILPGTAHARWSAIPDTVTNRISLFKNIKDSFSRSWLETTHASIFVQVGFWITSSTTTCFRSDLCLSVNNRLPMISNLFVVFIFFLRFSFLNMFLINSFSFFFFFA